MSFLANKLRARQIARQDAAKIGPKWYLARHGVVSYERGESPCWCPFSLGTAEHAAWMAGWTMAFDRRHP
jgi:hypothetical protein